jgi:hypothetical protein
MAPRIYLHSDHLRNDKQGSYRHYSNLPWVEAMHVGLLHWMRILLAIFKGGAGFFFCIMSSCSIFLKKNISSRNQTSIKNAIRMCYILV